jgi:hypothetical protein
VERLPDTDVVRIALPLLYLGRPAHATLAAEGRGERAEEIRQMKVDSEILLFS